MYVFDNLFVFFIIKIVNWLSEQLWKLNVYVFMSFYIEMANSKKTY